MAESTPTIRQVSWIAVIPQVAILAIAMLVALRFSSEYGFVLGAATYLLYSFLSRQIIATAHRRGIALVKAQRFGDAVSEFQKSFSFFERHQWIDQYRSIVLMSASAISFREMALANIGFCYSQIGNGVEARVYFEKCLAMFPESGLAKSALRMMDASSSQPATTYPNNPA